MVMGFLPPVTDDRVRAVQSWCLREYGGWTPTDIQVREVWQHYRGADTNFQPSEHFDGLTTLHIGGIIMAIEKAALPI